MVEGNKGNDAQSDEPKAKEHLAASPASSSNPNRNAPDAAEVGINMVAGAVSGALAKTSTAPLSRLTILYQVSLHMGQLLSGCVAA